MSSINLPQGWCLAKISNISIKGLQRAPDALEEFIYVDISSIERETKKITGPQKLLGKNAPSRARKVINKGDVIVSLTRPNLNAVALVPKKYDGQIASTGFEVIKPVIVDSRYIFGLVKSRHFIDEISGAVQGALYPAAKSSDVQSFEFPLPPLSEQKVIANKLDDMLSMVERIKARLELIPKILEKSRQSVLADAVSGKLTENWRRENSNKLLDKKEYATFIKEIFDRKSKVEKKRVAQVKESEWFYDKSANLPMGWIQANLIDITSLITCGVAKKPEYVSDGIPFLSAQNSKPFSPNLNKIKFIKESDFRKFTIGGKPSKGDVLYSRVGANFGEACVIPWDFDFAIYVSLTLIKPEKKLLNEDYLTIFLNSKDGLLQAYGGIMGSGIQNLNVESVRKFKVSLPSIDEQIEIVSRINKFFTYLETIESKTSVAIEKVNKLTQSILAKAFRGELTEQWRMENLELISGENSAEKLLAKIKIEKEK